MGNVVQSIVSVVQDVLGVGSDPQPQEVARAVQSGGAQKVATADGSNQMTASKRAYAGQARSRTQQAVAGGDGVSLATQGNQIQPTSSLGGGQMQERSLRRATAGSSNLLGE